MMVGDTKMGQPALYTKSTNSNILKKIKSEKSV